MYNVNFVSKDVRRFLSPHKMFEKYNEQEVFCKKKGVLKDFAIFTGKHLCWSLFLKKNTNLQAWNFIKKRLKHMYFTVNIAKLLRTFILKNIWERFPA